MNHVIKAECINYKELVSKSTKLSLTIQSKLVDKLKHHFNEEEQRWYIGNLYMYTNYHPTEEYPINLETVWKFVGFSNKANAKRLLKNNFTEEKDYKTIFIRSDENKNKERTLLLPREQQKNIEETRGRKEETIMLNINTFKKLCLKANTKEADKIHDYYVKLENVYNEIIKEEMEEKLEEQKRITEEQQKALEEIQKNIDSTIEEKSKLDKQNILLQQYKYVAILYIVLVKTLELGKYILKIGHSECGITRRFNDHSKAFSECILLDCFQVKLSRKFESFIHNELKHWRYKKLPGFEKQQELFIVGDGIEYNDILHIINKNIDRFNDPEKIIKELETENVKLEDENVKLETENVKLRKEIDDFNKHEKLDKFNKHARLIKKLETENVNLHKELDKFKKELEKEQVELQIQKLKVETTKTLEDIKREKHLEDARKRTQKYRQSDKYKEKIKTEEFRKKDNERKRNEEYKQKQKEYKQTEEYKEKRIEYNKKIRERRISKADIASSESEKNKLFNWCNENIIYDKKSFIEFKTFLEKYTVKPCPQVKLVYKSQIEQFIKEKFPTVNNLHKRFELNKIRVSGWRGLKIIE